MQLIAVMSYHNDKPQHQQTIGQHIMSNIKTINYKVKRHGFLSRDEEYFLLDNWFNKKCIISRNKIVNSNLMFIISVANKMRKKYSHVDFRDLIGYGNHGFIFGLDKVDLEFIKSKRAKISSYLVFWVKQFIQRGVEDNESAIRHPANIHEDMRKKVKSREDLSDTEKAWMDNVRGVNHIEDVIGDDDSNMTLADKYSFTCHDESDLADSMLIKKERSEVINIALDGLSEQDKQIMIHLFGLSGNDDMNLREVGEELGISHEQVRKRRMDILPSLQRQLRLNGITKPFR